MVDRVLHRRVVRRRADPGGRGQRDCQLVRAGPRSGCDPGRERRCRRSAGATSSVDDNGKLNVVTTVAPISSIVRNVGGTRIDLHGIVPDGTNSHTFEPAPSDARILSQADLVFVNGLDLERRRWTWPRRICARARRSSPSASRPSAGTSGSSTSRSPRRTGTRTRTSGPTCPTPSATPRSSPKRSRARSRQRRLLRGESGALQRRARRPRRGHRRGGRRPSPRRTASCSPTTTPGPTSRPTTDSSSSARPSRPTSPSRRRGRSPRLIDQIKAEDVPAVFGSEVFPSAVLEQIAQEAGATYIDQLRDDDPPGRAERARAHLPRHDAQQHGADDPALGGNVDAVTALSPADTYVR